MELWEYNAYVTAYQEKQKSEIVNSILTGYYVAYYTNGGKKAKNPNELIKKIYSKKQDLKNGLADIARLRALENSQGE